MVVEADRDPLILENERNNTNSNNETLQQRFNNIMQRMRVNINNRRVLLPANRSVVSRVSQPNRVMGCFHVRLAAGILGTWQLIFQLIILGCVMLALLKPELWEQLKNEAKYEARLLMHQSGLIKPHHMNDRHQDAMMLENSKPMRELGIFGSHDNSEHPKMHMMRKNFFLVGRKDPFGLDMPPLHIEEIHVQPMFSKPRSIMDIFKLFDKKIQEQTAIPNFLLSGSPVKIEQKKKALDSNSVIEPAEVRNKRSLGFDAHHSNHHDHDSPAKTRRRLYWALPLVSLCLIATSMLIYGVIAKKAVFLLPYIGMQLFGVLMYLVVIISFIYYFPNVKYWVYSKHCIPFRKELLHMDNTTLSLVLMTTTFSIFALKLYFLAIIWNCYRYLVSMHRAALGGSRGGRSHHGDATGASHVRLSVDVMPQFKADFLPHYEQCIKNPANAYMPPPYFPKGAKSETAEEQIVKLGDAEVTTNEGETSK